MYPEYGNRKFLGKFNPTDQNICTLKMEAGCSSKCWSQHNTLHYIVIQKIAMLIFTVSKTSGMSVTYGCISFLSGFPQLKSSFSSGGSCMTGKHSSRSCFSAACECNIMRRNFIVSSDSHICMVLETGTSNAANKY